MNKDVTGFSPQALDMLTEYNWPGNVRELRNVIERAVVVAKGKEIKPEDLSFPFLSPLPSNMVEGESLEEVEKRHIEKILARTKGNIAQAAEILKISRLTLYNKIEKYNLKR